ncbi:MAG: transglutaminase family protein [Bacteroidota bacterium]
MNVAPQYLTPGTFVDSDHPGVLAFAQQHTDPGQNLRERAVALFYAVRDGFRYNPYILHFKAEDMKASAFLHRTEGHCVDKANLYAAVCRAVGVPSRLHFANVRNHIGTARLEEFLKSDVLVFHGYAEVYLDGRWVVATPAFNRELCTRVGVAPLEFDGVQDALFQEYTAAQDDSGPRRFMEYLHDHGHFADWPRERFLATMKKHYGHLFTPERMEAMGLRVSW